MHGAPTGRAHAIGERENGRKRFLRGFYGELPAKVWSNPLCRRRWTRICARANGSGSSWRALLRFTDAPRWASVHATSGDATRRLVLYDV